MGHVRVVTLAKFADLRFKFRGEHAFDLVTCSVVLMLLSFRFVANRVQLLFALLLRCWAEAFVSESRRAPLV